MDGGYELGFLDALNAVQQFLEERIAKNEPIRINDLLDYIEELKASVYEKPR